MEINQEKLNSIINEELKEAAGRIWERLVDEFNLNKEDVGLEDRINKVSLLFGENKLTLSGYTDMVKHYITDGEIHIIDSHKENCNETYYILGGVIIKGGQIVDTNDDISYVAYQNADGIVVEKVETKEVDGIRRFKISVEDFGKTWEHKIKTQV